MLLHTSDFWAKQNRGAEHLVFRKVVKFNKILQSGFVCLKWAQPYPHQDCCSDSYFLLSSTTFSCVQISFINYLGVFKILSTIFFDCQNCTAFENRQKCLIFIFNFGISTNFCPVKNDLSGTTVWLKTSVFQKIFGILNESFSVIFKLSVSLL